MHQSKQIEIQNYLIIQGPDPYCFFKYLVKCKYNFSDGCR